MAHRIGEDVFPSPEDMIKHIIYVMAAIAYPSDVSNSQMKLFLSNISKDDIRTYIIKHDEIILDDTLTQLDWDHKENEKWDKYINDALRDLRMVFCAEYVYYETELRNNGYILTSKHNVWRNTKTGMTATIEHELSTGECVLLYYPERKASETKRNESPDVTTLFSRQSYLELDLNLANDNIAQLNAELIEHTQRIALLTTHRNDHALHLESLRVDLNYVRLSIIGLSAFTILNFAIFILH
jgi:hypothetical protein